MGGVYSRDTVENVVTVCMGPQSHHQLIEDGLIRILNFDRDRGILAVERRAHVSVPWVRVRNEDLYFYRRHRLRQAERALPYLRTVNEVDGAVCGALACVRDAMDQLDPTQTFAAYMSGLGWDPNRAEDGAMAAEWVADRGLTWPGGVNLRKVLLLADAEPDHPDEWTGANGATWNPQALLLEAVDASYSTLRAKLAEMGLVTLPVKLYLVFPPALARGVLVRGSGNVEQAHVRLIKTRTPEKLKSTLPRGSVIVTAGKIVGGMEYLKASRTYVDAEGVSIPHEER
jgi:hypothetical protein